MIHLGSYILYSEVALMSAGGHSSSSAADGSRALLQGVQFIVEILL